MENNLLPEEITVDGIISHIVQQALKKYKIDEKRAYSITKETLLKSPKFLEFLNKKPTFKQILKSRVFEDLNRSARQRIYYALRQYNTDSPTVKSSVESLKNLSPETPYEEYESILKEIAQTHTSTAERMNHADEFYGQLLGFLEGTQTLLDVGCGMQPLLFPFQGEGKEIKTYVAAEKDKLCIDALTAFSAIYKPGLLHAIAWNIADNWKVLEEQTGIRFYDAALLLKLVPVVDRIDRALLETLRFTPARKWIVSGSRESMTRQISIESRERKIIRRFLEQAGKTIIGEFSTPDEFCFIAESV